MRSAIMTTVRCRLARVACGMIDASMTRRPSVPSTRHSGSTTVPAASGDPIRQLEQTWTVSWTILGSS